MKNIILIAFLSFTFFSCKSLNNINSEVETNEVSISNKKFEELLVSSTKTYYNKYKTQPKILTVEFITRNALPKVVIFTTTDLYLNEKEKQFLNEKLVGGLLLNNMVVLFKNNPGKEDFFKIKNTKRMFAIPLGNDSGTCEEYFTIEKFDSFILDDRLWQGTN